MKRCCFTIFIFFVITISVLYGDTIYVDINNTSGIEDGSQANPFNTIQEGIDASLDEDIVLVADGTYIAVGNRDLDFKGKAITVQSENGPEFCIIDCENSGRGFWFHSGEIEQSVVSGFTITNGSALNGGGIHCENASPTITNNIIIENSASNFGGGISSWNSTIRINDSIIEDNFCSDWGSGAGVAILDGSSLIMRNSFVVGNSAPFNDGGGIYIDTSSCIIVNSVIANNSSEETGGGFCIENGSDYKIINSTIVGNQTPNAIGAAISVIYDAHITLTNCIVSNNVGDTGFDEKYGWGNSTITLNYCNTFNNSPDGSVSITRNYCLGDPPTEGVNPIFVDLDEDYHLQECSSCIGAGIMTLDVPDTDIEGNPRPNPLNSNPDLGAYESSLLEEVNISLSITVGTGGNTNPSPGDYCYSDGTEVTITATAEPEYRFSHWSGDASGTTNPITITMDSDKSITANFTVTPATETGGGDGGGCFIATAAYGSPFHHHLDILRDFRDTYLLPGKLGRKLVNFYSKHSPFLADFIAKHKVLKVVVRINLLPFVVFSYSIVHFGPIITAVIFVFIFMLPISLIAFRQRKIIKNQKSIMIEPSGSQIP